MDLPVHPSVDIYQIHRTPYFRRVHRKDSDEFERLKQAYESVRNFDEKPLQAQIKKIRLGKLLRRIKDTFSSSNKPYEQKKPRPRPKTKQQIRREALAKARQIGMDYSRQNLGAPLNGYTSQQERNDRQDDWKREKSRLERRLEYGNTKSQVNRTKIQRSQNLNSQRLEYTETTSDIPTSTTKQRLDMLKKNLTKKEFMKFLVHCLSSDKPNPVVLNAFEEILQSRNDLYWDLVEAIEQRQQYIKRYGKFMKKLSNLAFKGVPEVKSREQADVNVETFDSKTNIKPANFESPEVYIRTYRYTDKDDFLPPPSESLLRIPTEETEANSVIPDRMDLQDIERAATTSSYTINKSSSHLSAKLLKTIQMDPVRKNTMSKKFGNIIRNTVRRESAVMLANLEKAMKH